MKNNYLAVMSVATVLACVPFSTQAVSINSTDWSCNLTESVISGAGDYFSSTLTPESTAGLTCSNATLSISNATDTNWVVSARWVNINKPKVENLTVALTRTGDGDVNGNGNSELTGGNNPIHLTSANKIFFKGKGNISDIPLSFQIQNFSVNNGRDWDANNAIQIVYDVAIDNL